MELSAAECRVLGCLIEKAATTPDVYPMTLNSLRTACNQSTSRDPVVDYDDHTVEQALTGLREQGVVRVVHSPSNRATKYRQVAEEFYHLDPAQVAVLAVLLLRGPQTVGELKTRTERQYRFPTTDGVESTLVALSTRLPPLVTQLERQPGHKEARWMHTLGGMDADTPESADDTTEPAVTPGPEPAAQAAEFVDLLTSREQTSLAESMLDVLANLDPANGPIVVIACGPGAFVEALHDAASDIDIVACEPELALRTGLASRLAASQGLRSRVTVRADLDWDDADNAADGDRGRSAVSAVIVPDATRLDADQRRRLWRTFEGRVGAHTAAFVALATPTDFATSTVVGTQRYEMRRRVQAEATSATITDTYTVVDEAIDGASARTGQREVSVVSSVDLVSVAQLAGEVETLGLRLTPRGAYSELRRA